MKNLFILILLVNAKSFCEGHDSLDDSPDDIDALLNSVDLQMDEGSGIEDHIVGGKEISVLLAPYQVQILTTYSKTSFCGGTIIHEEWILTAAHCLTPFRGAPEYFFIKTGSNIRNEGVDHEVEKMIIHKDYDRDINTNDIALLKLKKPIIFDESQNKIDFIDREVQEGESLFISGFGHEQHEGEPSKQLKGASVPITNKQSCAKTYEKHRPKGHRKHYQITDGMFCAGNGKNDSCQGDSGGPAVIDHKLAGVVSFGNKCALADYPGIYTSVLKYRDWIEKKTKVPGIGQQNKGGIMSRIDNENEVHGPIKKTNKRPKDNQQKRDSLDGSSEDIDALLNSVDLQMDEGSGTEDHIVGGKKIEIQLAPYQIQICTTYLRKSFCGGTIINENWILTAAHCLKSFIGAPEYLFIYSGSNLPSRGQEHEIEKIILHEDYDRHINTNDIALLKLKKPIIFNESQNKIDFIDREVQEGENIFVTGFGHEQSGGKPSEQLKGTLVPITNLKSCAETYGKHKPKGHSKYFKITDRMFCAGNGKNDSCQGDSGGPAVIDHKLAGVVSFGNKCALADYPGIYTSVLKYRDWIEKKTKVPGIGQKNEGGIISIIDDGNDANVPVEKTDDPLENDQRDQMVADARVPYRVQIRGSISCGGAIIDEVWVLTAAQCLNGITNDDEIDILIGGTTYGGGIPAEVERKIIHERYNTKYHKNNIALIKLKSPVVYSEKVSKIKIGNKLPKKGKLLLTGYEKKKTKTSKLVASYTPEVILKKGKNHKLRAQLEIPKGCLKGYGGPVTIDGKLFGIATHDCVNYPPVYTLVPEYRSWIESITHLKDL